MQNFTYHNPTKIIFGTDTIAKIGEITAPIAKKVLYLYGKGSIKKNGIYDKTINSLRTAGIECVEYDGVKANPLLSHTREGIEIARRAGVEAIVAVGGGSVIDEGKAIAAGVVADHDVWQFYNGSGDATVKSALPILTVLTMSATGTEMNGGTVLTNEETKQKIGIMSPFLQPIASILDPTALFSVPADQTAYGAVDAITHLLESYFTKSDSYTPIQDRYVEGIVKTITEITEKMQSTPNDLTARSTFMWAATLAWNGMAPSGVGSWAAPNHLIGHSMSALYDTPHGASLSIALSGWLPWYAEQNEGNKKQLLQFGKAIFDTSNVDDTIECFRSWCRSINSPTKLADIGVDDAGLVNIAANIGENSPLWGLPDYTDKLCESILRRCK
ncbi:MAG: iron-containing alcohol dehydrogenase [Planctomycetaceae bacterium]|jgi:alcohol dehydrogenase YqhD (iron-dependent ADH family)|nr:iron-containing alcohol dehydrogenase [Planctomycetaceae bacterium]